MMDLTPLEVRKKKGDFRRQLRGYDSDLVDDFLDLVADRMDELVRENHAFAERLEKLERQVSENRDREKALTEALVTAQEMREELRRQAAREAEEAREQIQRQSRATLEDAERAARTLRETAEREARELRETVERESRTLRETAERETNELRASTERELRVAREATERELAELRERVERQTRAARESAAGEAEALVSEARAAREREEAVLRRWLERKTAFLGAWRALLEAELAVLERAGADGDLELDLPPAPSQVSTPAVVAVAAATTGALPAAGAPAAEKPPGPVREESPPAGARAIGDAPPRLPAGMEDVDFDELLLEEEAAGLAPLPPPGAAREPVAGEVAAGVETDAGAVVRPEDVEADATVAGPSRAAGAASPGGEVAVVAPGDALRDDDDLFVDALLGDDVAEPAGFDFDAALANATGAPGLDADADPDAGLFGWGPPPARPEDGPGTAELVLSDEDVIDSDGADAAGTVFELSAFGERRPPAAGAGHPPSELTLRPLSASEEAPDVPVETGVDESEEDDMLGRLFGDRP
jgi:DivIVA domain-containing protein